jgi:tetratricopeptide (TPR) repeat protein
VRCSVAPLVGVLVLIGCVTTPLSERDWIELRTTHFEIVSSLGEDATLELARDAELFRSVTEFAIGGPLRAPAVPTRIYAFDGRGITQPFAVRGARGHFQPTLREGLIVLRAGGGWGGDATESLRHAYVHYLVHNQEGFGQPLWLDEGSAQFLSTGDPKGDHVELGRIREDHVRFLRGQTWMPLIRVLRAEDLEGWGSRERQTFSAESWALVHYLNLGLEGSGRGPAELGGYLRRVAGGVPHERALREAFGVGSTDLDRTLRRYVRGDRFDSVELRFGHDEGVGTPQTRPLARDEVVTRLGWLSISLQRGERAQRYFETAVSSDPSNARAHAGLGAAERLGGRWDAALPHYERALALAPDDILVQLDVGAYYHSRAGEAGNAETRAQLVALARRHYARSSELDDSLPEAHAMYGATFLLEDEEAERGLEALERANRLLPASLEIKLLLAQLYARLRRFEEARDLAVAVLSHTHSEVTRGAAQELLADVAEDVVPRDSRPDAA